MAYCSCEVKGKYFQSIKDTEVDGNAWAEKHFKTLCASYKRAKHFSEIKDLIEPLYANFSDKYLSLLNFRFVELICNYLNITTKITSSSEYDLTGDATDRLLCICKQAEATEYVSGPSAKNYMKEELFAAENINLTFFDYDGYPEYQQLWGDFIHEVSVLDLLFNCGKDSPRYMKHYNRSIL